MRKVHAGGGDPENCGRAWRCCYFFFSVFFTPFNLFGYIWLTPDPCVLNENKAGIYEGIERGVGLNISHRLRAPSCLSEISVDPLPLCWLAVAFSAMGAVHLVL